ALDRVRRQGPASGRRRQGRPRRAEDVVGDHVQVHLEERRARRLPRPTRGGEGRDRLEVEGRLRRAHPRRGFALGHLPVHQDRGGRGRHRPRGDGVEDRRGAALLPHVAWPLRGGGVGDDRQRLRRADHEGAAARVRRRDEPADPAPDGRLRRLIEVERVDYIRVPVDDIEKAKHFYGDVLGLRRFEKLDHEDWIEYEAGNVTLAVMTPETHDYEFAPL